MKLFRLVKDGGPLSRVWAYVLIELKCLFSIVLLHFKDGSREAYHTHAFNAWSWVLKGSLTEVMTWGEKFYWPSWKPIYTPRERLHKVVSHGDTWVLTFRGPWVDKWYEWLPEEGNKLVFLTHGRKVTKVIK